MLRGTAAGPPPLGRRGRSIGGRRVSLDRLFPRGRGRGCVCAGGDGCGVYVVRERDSGG